MKPDTSALAVGLAALAFAVILFVAPRLDFPLIQPLLASALVGAGLIALMSTVLKTKSK